jgi:hypothetical protein
MKFDSAGVEVFKLYFSLKNPASSCKKNEEKNKNIVLEA